ncbi:MAG: hypothetical protein JW846_01850 [Dehalococcoidia bacterium]|nr:hypothetical protein [Dehalococcoidia bacterium]
MGSSSKSSAINILGTAFAVLLFGTFFFVPTVDPEPENARPSIETFVASHDEVYALQSCVLFCAAHDEDGDVLSYTWSSTGGTLVTHGETATWTAPQREGSYGIMVEVSDGAGETDSSVTLVTVARNQSPIINAVSCERPFLLQGQATPLTCDATDTDGHALDFTWSCVAGSFSGTGPTVQWTAPMAKGTYVVSVVVTDALGAACTHSELVKVAPSEPPTIDDIIVLPQLLEYSKEYDWGFRLLKGSRCICELECVASARDTELTYSWSCDGGTIEPSGSVVLFTPPNEQAEVTATVIVTDRFGLTATEEVFFKVFNREVYSTTIDEVPGGCNCNR